MFVGVYGEYDVGFFGSIDDGLYGLYEWVSCVRFEYLVNESYIFVVRILIMVRLVYYF